MEMFMFSRRGPWIIGRTVVVFSEELGTSYQVLGSRYQILGIRYHVPGTKYHVSGTMYQVPGIKYQVHHHFASSHFGSNFLKATQRSRPA